MSGLDGILVLDKPRGPTSHDVVSRLRRALGTRAIGHAGTLDPMATGVLVAAIGEGTKLVPWLTAQDKSYEATIALGVETDTLDAEGREVIRVRVDDALRDALRGVAVGVESPRLRAALDAERARVTQLPPTFSAIRTNGERSFDRARRGESVKLEIRPVRVVRLDVLAYHEDRASPEGPLEPSLDVSLDVGKGYYVRALARDLARALGTVGHLTSLRRTRSGCFVASEAVGLDAPAETLRERIEPLARAATRALPAARVTLAGAIDARHGKLVGEADIAAPLRGGPCAWLDPQGVLVAVGQCDDEGRGKVVRGFVQR